MNALLKAMNQSGTTENGAVTNVTSLSSCVDFFFKAGASRGKDIRHLFDAALAENEDVAVRTLLWLRDVRGGAGERQLFRDLCKHLIKTHRSALVTKIMNRIPDLGRWDDVIDLLATDNGKIFKHGISMIEQGLEDRNGLLAKWLPRKGLLAVQIRSALGMTPKQYRKTIVNLSNTVEQNMCSNDWNGINYSHVPSKAASIYKRAFNRHDPAGYGSYREELAKPKEERDPSVKINAGAIFPYDILKSLNMGLHDVADAQWAALPNYLEGSDEKMIVVADVSGSMSSEVSPGTTALSVCISLAMYLAERLEGPFKDSFITFSSSPELQILKGSLSQRVNQLAHAQWMMSTNLQAVFSLILDKAIKHRVPESEMPTKILIMSDMEFNSACSNQTNLEAIRKKYAQAGYQMPGIVFWNINNRNDRNFPATVSDKNVALISGFSPSIVKSVLGGKDLSPVGVVLKTVMVDRYNYK